jgi:hypothetical protein
VVRLVEPDDIIDKMTYALTNPVKDGLVEKAHHWPGVTSLGAITRDSPLVASRPKHFFRDKEGPMPEVVSLVFVRPHEFKDLTARAFAERVRERVQIVEETAAAERRRTGGRVLGRRAVLDQKWSDRPGSREPRRQLNPSVAARSKWSRIEALLRNRAFRDVCRRPRRLRRRHPEHHLPRRNVLAPSLYSSYLRSLSSAHLTSSLASSQAQSHHARRASGDRAAPAPHPRALE